MVFSFILSDLSIQEEKKILNTISKQFLAIHSTIWLTFNILIKLYYLGGLESESPSLTIIKQTTVRQDKSSNHI